MEEKKVICGMKKNQLLFLSLFLVMWIIPVISFSVGESGSGTTGDTGGSTTGTTTTTTTTTTSKSELDQMKESAKGLIAKIIIPTSGTQVLLLQKIVATLGKVVDNTTSMAILFTVQNSINTVSRLATGTSSSTTGTTTDTKGNGKGWGKGNKIDYTPAETSNGKVTKYKKLDGIKTAVEKQRPQSIVFTIEHPGESDELKNKKMQALSAQAAIMQQYGAIGVILTAKQGENKEFMTQIKLENTNETSILLLDPRVFIDSSITTKGRSLATAAIVKQKNTQELTEHLATQLATMLPAVYKNTKNSGNKKNKEEKNNNGGKKNNGNKNNSKGITYTPAETTKGTIIDATDLLVVSDAITDQKPKGILLCTYQESLKAKGFFPNFMGSGKKSFVDSTRDALKQSASVIAQNSLIPVFIDMDLFPRIAEQIQQPVDAFATYIVNPQVFINDTFKDVGVLVASYDDYNSKKEAEYASFLKSQIPTIAKAVATKNRTEYKTSGDLIDVGSNLDQARSVIAEQNPKAVILLAHNDASARLWLPAMILSPAGKETYDDCVSKVKSTLRKQKSLLQRYNAIVISYDTSNDATGEAIMERLKQKNDEKGDTPALYLINKKIITDRKFSEVPRVITSGKECVDKDADGYQKLAVSRLADMLRSVK